MGKTPNQIVHGGMNIIDWFFLNNTFIGEIKRRLQSRFITKFLRASDKVLFGRTRKAERNGATTQRQREILFVELDEHGRPMKWTKAMLSESAYQVAGKRFSPQTTKKTMVKWIKRFLAGTVIISGLYVGSQYVKQRKKQEQQEGDDEVSAGTRGNALKFFRRKQKVKQE